MRELLPLAMLFAFFHIFSQAPPSRFRRQRYYNYIPSFQFTPRPYGYVPSKPVLQKPQCIAQEVFPWVYYTNYEEYEHRMEKGEDLPKPLSIHRVEGPVQTFINREYMSKLTGWSLVTRTGGLPDIPVFFVDQQEIHIECPVQGSHHHRLPLTHPSNQLHYYNTYRIDESARSKFEERLSAVVHKEAEKYITSERVGIWKFGFAVRLRRIVVCPMFIEDERLTQQSAIMRISYVQLARMPSPTTRKSRRGNNEYRAQLDAATPTPIIFEGSTPWDSSAPTEVDSETKDLIRYWKNVSVNDPNRNRQAMDGDGDGNAGNFISWCPEKGAFESKDSIFRYTCIEYPVSPAHLFPDDIFRISCLGLYPHGTVAYMGDMKGKWFHMRCKDDSKWDIGRMYSGGANSYNKCNDKNTGGSRLFFNFDKRTR